MTNGFGSYTGRNRVLLRQGMSVEEIVPQYPALKPADVHGALAYAYDHLDEIEADLAGHDEATVKARHASDHSAP